MVTLKKLMITVFELLYYQYNALWMCNQLLQLPCYVDTVFIPNIHTMSYYLIIISFITKKTVTVERYSLSHMLNVYYLVCLPPLSWFLDIGE